MNNQRSDKSIKLFMFLFFGFFGYLFMAAVLFIVFILFDINAWYGIYIPVISFIGVIFPLLYLNRVVFKS